MRQVPVMPRRFGHRELTLTIDTLRDRFGVELLCRVLVTDYGNYVAWVRTLDQRRDRGDEQQRLTMLILDVHAAHPVYGVLHVTHDLQRQGIPVGQHAEARLMWE